MAGSTTLATPTITDTFPFPIPPVPSGCGGRTTSTTRWSSSATTWSRSFQAPGVRFSSTSEDRISLRLRGVSPSRERSCSGCCPCWVRAAKSQSRAEATPKRRKPCWVERGEVGRGGSAVDNQLGHCLAGRRRVENAPDTVASGDIGPFDAGYLADQRQSVRGDRTIAGLSRHDPRGGEHRRQFAAHRLETFERARIGGYPGRIDRQRAFARDCANIGGAVCPRKQP